MISHGAARHDNARPDTGESGGDGRTASNEDEGLWAESGTLESRWRMSIAAALMVFIVVWLMVGIVVDSGGFAVVVSEKLRGGEEAASALARLFAALVLGLFLAEGAGRRMRWVAGGLLILGLGHLIFGYLEPLIQNDPPELNESLYEVFVTRIFACALFAIGLFPGRPPRILVKAAVAVPVALLGGYLLIFEILEGESWMPALATIEDAERAIQLGSSFDWLTPWHWALSALPLGLALAALAGAFWQSRRGLLPGWLLMAMVLLAGSLLHEYLWPTGYGDDVLTTADALSLMFAVVVAIGGVTELRRVASERAALLATERERIRRLGEIATLKADFTAIVAHELDGPVSAIRRLTEMLAAEESDPAIRRYATSTMEVEIDALNALTRDVREAASVERSDFEVEPISLPLALLLKDAKAYASTLPGDHPVKIDYSEGAGERVMVWADPERIGQVLRNLLSNAAKYSTPGTPIEIRAIGGEGRVRVEVADRGPGIHPDDLSRIFEKFGRGRDGENQKVAGVVSGSTLAGASPGATAPTSRYARNPAKARSSASSWRWRDKRGGAREDPGHAPRRSRLLPGTASVHAGTGGGSRGGGAGRFAGRGP